ncbi:MAG: urea ABC transporter permease subunit UrtB [Pseudomonadota bacterium]
MSLLMAVAMGVRAESFDEILESFPSANAAERRTLLQDLAATGDVRVGTFFEVIARGALYVDRRSDTLVEGVRKGSRYELSNWMTGEALGEAGRRDVRRVPVDNQLRGELDRLLATAQLSAASAAVRRAAIQRIASNPSAGALEAMRQRQGVEPVAELRLELTATLAIASLAGDDASEMRKALLTLSERRDTAVRAALVNFLARDDLAPQLTVQAQTLLDRIEYRLRVMGRIESVFFGLSLGSVLLLAAIGLAITFGVMGVINMAHGELIMLGAYTTWVLQQLMPAMPGAALLLAIPAAFVVSGAMGWLIERSVISRLYGRPLETLLATFGISLILQQMVRTVFGPLNRFVVTPEWLSGAWTVTPGLTLTYNRLAILVFCLMAFFALMAVMRYTRLGLHVRAVSQNREMARALGIRSARVDAMTFALGSGVAGIAGVALSQLTNVGPNLGQAYIIDSFLVVVFGGVGNLWGTLVGAFSLGITTKLLEPATGAVLAKILLLVALILFLQRRPQGLFPKTGRQDAI